MPDQTQDKVLPQIKSTAANVIIILVIGPMAGCSLSYFNGELHTWTDIPKAIDHAMFASLLLAFGWIAMASPLGKRFQTLISAIRSTPSGEQQEMRVALDQPADHSKTTTATIDPNTQVVTIKETPTPAAPSAADSTDSKEKP